MIPKLNKELIQAVDGHDQIEAVNPETGRLHTHYSQAWTATARMQSNDPNLQTIPVRKERGRDIRAAFVPRDDDHRLLSADYSQIELRVMAELSGDQGMLEAFTAGADITMMARVNAEPVVLVHKDRNRPVTDLIARAGRDSDLTMLGLNFPDREHLEEYAVAVEEMIRSVGTVLLVRNAQADEDLLAIS